VSLASVPPTITNKPDGAAGAAKASASLTQETKIAPPCHQSLITAASIDTHDSEMETATVIAEPNMSPNSTKDYQIKTAFPKNKDSQDMMSDFIFNMFEQDKAFTIYAYDPMNTDNYLNLCIAKDIPSYPFNFSKYFAKMCDSQNKTHTTIVFQITAPLESAWQLFLCKGTMQELVNGRNKIW
jgi:hypothetical protein